MQAFEFEVKAKNNLIEIPVQYNKLYSQYMKVIVLVPEGLEKKQKYDFSDVAGKLQWQGNAIKEQRKMCNEW
ncbi:hypothetical protein TI05_03525 [Achromatium sp. WMS3]|nr:hypothetical protein TI05_03525 [Achromatium sp. WMS3]